MCKGDVAPYTGYLIPPLQMKDLVADAEAGELVPELKLAIDDLNLRVQDQSTLLRAKSLEISSLQEDLLEERHAFDWGDFFKGVGLGTAVGAVAVVVGLLLL